MYFAPFYTYFPKLAPTETRSVTVVDYPNLPDGEYGLIESYCKKPGCDCRRVMLNIYTSNSNELKAVIAYGWESKAFYTRWYSDDDPDMIQQMQGPILNFGSPQTAIAPGLLQLVSNILEDKAYVERLKRHYQLFKKVVNEKAGHMPKQKRNRQFKFKKKRKRRR